MLINKRRRGGPWIAALAAGALALVLGSTTAAQAASNDWLQPGGDAGHSFSNLGESGLTATSVTRLRQLWQRSDGYGELGPAVAGGVAYYSFTEYPTPNAAPVSGVRAVRLDDGAVLWSVVLDAGAGDAVDSSRALAVSGHVLFAAGRSDRGPAGVTAIDLPTHRVLWTARVSDSPQPGLANGDLFGFALDSSRFYVMADDGSLDAFDEVTGHRVWTIPGGWGVASLVGVSDGFVFFANQGGVIQAADARTGVVRWRVNDFGYATTIAGGKLVVADQQSVRAYPAAGCGVDVCAPVWSTSTGRATDSQNSDDSVALSAGAGGVLALTFSPGEPVLQTRDLATGALRWQAELGGQQLSYRPVVQAGSLLYTMVDDKIIAFPSSCAALCKTRLLVGSIDAPGYSPAPTLSIGGDHVLVQGWEPNTVTAFGVPAPAHAPAPPRITVPSAPRHLSARGAHRSITVTFERPASLGGSSSVRYQYSLDRGRHWHTLRVHGNARPTATIGHLHPRTRYTVQLRATDPAGAGHSSARVSVRTTR